MVTCGTERTPTLGSGPVKSLPNTPFGAPRRPKRCRRSMKSCSRSETRGSSANDSFFGTFGLFARLLY
jgi:hypothetical protein